MNNNPISQKKAWYIVLISSLMGCSISSAFPQFSMTVSSVAEKTGLSESFLLATDTLKSAAIVVAMLCSGFFYKKFGARITFIIALICMALPQFVIPYTSVPALLIFWKLVQGFSSVIFPVFLLIIMDVISERQAGLATAVFNGIFYSGGGVGGTLAGFFIAKSGWLSSYFALGIIALVIGLILLFTVKDTTKDKASDAADVTADNLNEEKTSSLTLLKMPVVWLLILAFISTTFVIQAITVDLPLFSQWLGYDELASGKINTAVTIGLLAACLVSGQISDMVARRMSNKGRARILVMAVGPILIIVASLMLILLDLTSFGLFYATAFIFSFGGSWGLGTFYSILPEIFDEERLPIITGLAGGAGDMGMPLAPLLVGVVFGARGMWHLGWSVCIVISLLSILACFLLLGNKKLRAKQD
ncbi:MAG: MFS transporter [Lentihominibacter sp.]|uniref:MFS transporter n=1 Tax=Lentihominibacter sp. TaxID=2944216 RepID=UPI002A9177E3|nr:MFS transporter [Lentihominibacter sp.]MDY5287260.1 MFS transporter [Lentihominibacter sp.]